MRMLVSDMAGRANIQLKGEELGYDYGKSYFDSFIEPIGCRCLKCMSEKAWAKLQVKQLKKKTKKA